ncbi:olfactomedin-4-like [Coregonus clupeaformis]|uniref:olfactomedin-4-like n=1 Tax=Coregonus clupeaformis TaxID=59861 RepID=UPI001BE01A02|nr:olfactomedin-4-like [Coregonus clupeaformis]
MSNISTPVVTNICLYGKSYTSVSWGRQAKQGMEDQEGSGDFYCVQPLVNGHRLGNIIHRYSPYDDFMTSKNHEDVTKAPSHNHANAIQGSCTVVYGEAVFYNCCNSAELGHYDLQIKVTSRLKIPEFGYNNQFPYCYYNCKDWTDIDFAADETGLRVIYSMRGNPCGVTMETWCRAS